MIKILVATNRNPVRDESGKEIDFGEEFNHDPGAGPVELRFAWATCNDEGQDDGSHQNPNRRGLEDQEIGKGRVWSPEGPGYEKIDYNLEIIADNKDGAPPSEALFKLILGNVIVDKSKASDRWLLFVHGYGNKFKASIESAIRLAYRYKRVKESQQSSNTTINIILFSWPSHPGGKIATSPIAAYRQTQRAAEQSSYALSRLLDRISDYFIKPARQDKTLAKQLREIQLSIMTHSLGNYLLESYVRSGGQSEKHLGLVRRVTLHQADVNEIGHAEWINQIAVSRDIWITQNRFDYVLRWLSDAINPLRLGQETARPEATATYVDCTKVNGLQISHNVFLAADKRLKKLCCCLMDGDLDPLAGLIDSRDPVAPRANSFYRDSVFPNFWRFGVDENL